MHEVEQGRLGDVASLMGYLERHPLDVSAALSSLGSVRWNGKEPLEILFGRIEAWVEQARFSWSPAEQLREGVRVFWRAVDRPEWKAEVIRMGNEAEGRVEFLGMIRKLEALDRVSKRGPLVLSVSGSRRSEDVGGQTNGNDQRGRCFTCGGKGHFAAVCPSARTGGEQAGGPGRREFGNARVLVGAGTPRCYRCGNIGHLSSGCTRPVPGSQVRQVTNSENEEPRR